MVKAELERDGKDYEEINLSLYPERWDEILEYTDGVKLTPVVIDGYVTPSDAPGFGIEVDLDWLEARTV